MILSFILNSGCARRGASGALFPKSALCGAEFPLRVLGRKILNHFDRPPRNRRSRTSSGPEGSSDKWCGLCRGSIPVMWLVYDSGNGLNRGCTTTSRPFHTGRFSSLIVVSLLFLAKYFFGIFLYLRIIDYFRLKIDDLRNASDLKIMPTVKIG